MNVPSSRSIHFQFLKKNKVTRTQAEKYPEYILRNLKFTQSFIVFINTEIIDNFYSFLPLQS